VRLEELRDTFLAEISRGSGAERVLGEVWRLPGLVEAELGQPDHTFTGKILHVSQRRVQPAAAAR
jgi:hypothetical protein